MKNSPYLDRPLLPLAVALPRMLQEIETALVSAGPAETRRLRQRADLIRELLATTPDSASNAGRDHGQPRIATTGAVPPGLDRFNLAALRVDKNYCAPFRL